MLFKHVNYQKTKVESYLLLLYLLYMEIKIYVW